MVRLSAPALSTFLAYQIALLLLSHFVSGLDDQDSLDDQHRNPLLSVVDVVHVTTLTVSNHTFLVSARHKAEKDRLLRRLYKSKLFKGKSHPRDRLLNALYGFSRYGEATLGEIDRFESLYNNVPRKHKDFLSSAIGYEDTLSNARILITKNGQVCNTMVQNALEYYQVSQSELDVYMQQAEKDNKKPDRMSVSQAMKLFVRDWSVEGAYERKDTIPCILSTIKQNAPALEADMKADGILRFLVPGAGLGRLAHEIAADFPKHTVISNEWSAYVNIAYRYFETLSAPHSFAMHPYIDSWSHLRTRSEAERNVTIPDIVPRPSNVLLVEGDFTRIFDSSAHAGTYDFIVTLFFIDTARNLMAYFETIHKLLRKGGLWMNMGPLLWGSAPFMQLSLDEVVTLIKKMGFEFEQVHDSCGVSSLHGELVRGKEALYNFNGSALNKFAYEAQSWVVRKL